MDFGQQPLANAFREVGQTDDEFFFRLAVGLCGSCTMVQLVEEVPRIRMFHDAYPYHSSGSSVMRKHFDATARHFLETELTGHDPFIVELGCNDGIMLKAVAEEGVRHLGVEPCGGVAELAKAAGVRVISEFFQDSTAAGIRAADGPADVIFAANTISHIPYMESILSGVDRLLKPDGIFVFEDPYLGDIVRRSAFDQIYDEHFYFFTARSVRAMAERHGFALVDVERLPVHGGEVRYTLARQGARHPTASVAELLAEEEELGLGRMETLRGFAANVRKNRDDLVALLTDLRAQGRTVIGYGAAAKSATVTNYCGIGPDLVAYVTDSTAAKQGRLTPGSHLPVRPPSAFSDPYPDYALLFAWNHAEEIMAKERAFHEAGGKWILWVPEVRIV
ncbi:class I SAM-dependent methyltransferase [Thermocatellispora tengchongensis]